jgi:adenylate cyclase
MGASLHGESTGHAEPLGDLDIVPMSARWLGILKGESPLAFGERLGRRVFSLVPSGARCKFCNAPFRGRYAGMFGRLGYTPSRKNPNICERCIERAPEGGALVPVSVFFADVRGYTTISEQQSSVETTALLHRFYQTASVALLAHDAILGQIAGDEVMAIFVPGLAGHDYPGRAVQAGLALLRGVGYASPTGSWLNVGVGICSGQEYVGNVGGGGFKDFTAIGDVTNTAARLQAKAAGGEIIMDAATYATVAVSYPDAEYQALELKGKQSPVGTFRIRVG